MTAKAKLLNEYHFKLACNQVLKECDDVYAKAYAAAGITMKRRDEQVCQSLYILNNIQHWQGETARTVRYTLRKFANL